MFCWIFRLKQFYKDGFYLFKFSLNILAVLHEGCFFFFLVTRETFGCEQSLSEKNDVQMTHFLSYMMSYLILKEKEKSPVFHASVPTSVFLWFLCFLLCVNHKRSTRTVHHGVVTYTAEMKCGNVKKVGKNLDRHIFIYPCASNTWRGWLYSSPPDCRFQKG